MFFTFSVPSEFSAGRSTSRNLGPEPTAADRKNPVKPIGLDRNSAVEPRAGSRMLTVKPIGPTEICTSSRGLELGIYRQADWPDGKFARQNRDFKPKKISVKPIGPTENQTVKLSECWSTSLLPSSTLVT